MKTITRKEFIEQVGVGAAVLFVAACAGSCKKTTTASINFTVNVASGALATKGGYLIQDGVIVAHTSTGSFVAVSATCTHQGGTLGFSSDTFACPVHGATFNTAGAVLTGPASTNLQKYNTSLSGSSLRVYS
ncbi:MAG TPA: Rieske (2Fe-2S) protein [Bacteroidia bacterium]|jgi:cytochrome b6-f complex iron-sulfur subunit|nr:Rieske (2Fe-2S) protein [Bacteroidia bacterium]